MRVRVRVSTLDEPDEDTAHRLGVDALVAVEDEHLHGRYGGDMGEI